jgi:hypothetical protein
MVGEARGASELLDWASRLFVLRFFVPFRLRRAYGATSFALFCIYQMRCLR